MSLKLDKSTWKRVAFGDVVRNHNETLKDATANGIDRVIAMEHMDPGELEVPRWGNISDGTTFTRRVRPGQTLFGKRRAYQRKVAYAEFDAICSGDIYTFEADQTQILPELLPFLVQSDPFFDHAIDTSAGSLSPRTNWRDLADFEFDVAPLDEQKRIADLLWAVERHQRGLTEQQSTALATMGHLLRERFAANAGDIAKISDLAAAVVGGVWGSPEGEDEVDVLALGPRVYANGATRLSTDGSPTRSISRRQAATRVVESGDIILERSGGSPDQPVGRVVIADGDLPACIPTDFQRLIRPDSKAVEPLFLFWKLRSDWLEGATRDYSKRTTNIANLSVPAYLDRTIRVPSRAEQLRLVADADAIERALSSISTELAATKRMRTTLLTETFGDN
ncbi:restriction endonuclease subunit S [Microbacterium sp. P01]|uniref:restriction endonuclease subunit S n=1 Tax=Microbacterium sp. P01 TaxID=3366261 RepID=UPI00366DE9E8